jgi:hypothetical protein
MTILPVDSLPTPLARVAQRFEAVGPHGAADSFLIAGYVAESAIKLITAAFQAGLRAGAKENAYAVAHRLLRADGLGEFDTSLADVTTHPVAGFLPPDFHPLLAWLTKKRGSSDPLSPLHVLPSIKAIHDSLGLDPPEFRSNPTLRQVIRELVLVRNKTRGHGALGPDLFLQLTPHYVSLVRLLLMDSPLFECDWLHLSMRASDTIRGMTLRGLGPRYAKDSDVAGLRIAEAGLHLIPNAQTRRPYFLGDLVRSNSECSEFWLPNGQHRPDGTSEFVDYATGRTARISIAEFSRPPAPLPDSETHGLADLDVQSNVFGNLPPHPHNYVDRPKVEEELKARLMDRNHTVITLHGRGGIGKTSLALHVAHELADGEQSRFESIVWFSARDIDLRPQGPAPVRPRVTDLRSIARSFGKLFNQGLTEEDFARVLASPSDERGSGRLFIFDNFETLEDARGVHQFLDTYTHLPNKVLITSRERAFKADYPIEVRGMEAAEARELLSINAKELGIEGLITPEVVESIYAFTDGHPYVMRLMLGEIAKERRYVSPQVLLPQKVDIVNAVFERSFNKLSDAGRRVFLLVATWKSRVLELALLVICGQRGLDAEAGIEECLRLSLIERDEMADGQPCLRAPELARLFAKRKFDSDFDKFLIQEDSTLLQKFGVIPPKGRPQGIQDTVVRSFLNWAAEEARVNRAAVDGLDRLMVSVADLWPPAWSAIVDFRMTNGGDIAYALRRLVEEQPDDSAAWMKRAEYSKSAKDELTYISCLVSAVDAAPDDVELIREVAFQLCKFLDAHKFDIPQARRGVYLAGVRSHMEQVARQLDATGLSRLAWLFILEGNDARGREFASEGLRKDPNNEYCKRIIERLPR